MHYYFTRVQPPHPHPLPKYTVYPWCVEAMRLATGGWVTDRWLVSSRRLPGTRNQVLYYQMASHQEWLGLGTYSGCYQLMGSWVGSWLVYSHKGIAN